VSNGELPRLLLTGATLADGKVRSLFLEGAAVVAVGAGAERIAARRDTPLLDLAGYVVLPAASEPHAHLDKALLAGRVINVTGDLDGAITATRAAYPSMTADDVLDRARRALVAALRHGYTAVRTHVTCEAEVGTIAVEALIELRERAKSVFDLQIAAMAGFPITGSDGDLNRRLLLASLDAGADVVGGAPALDPDPGEATKWLVRLAADRGLPIDLHLDETLDPKSLCVRDFAVQVKDAGLAGRATASHCVSLGQQDSHLAQEVAKELAEAGVAVVTLPQTNLYLQGRGIATRVPRALTPVAMLRRAGVTVAGGGDNWRDPFNPMSRIDPLETASLLVTVAHLSAADAYDAVSGSARAAMGLASANIAPGHECDLLCVRGENLVEAIANASDDRIVIHRGRIVARTRVLAEVKPDL
jgi:cytosine/creatinine deaminase